MSTRDFIDPSNFSGTVSEMESMAITLMAGMNVISPSVDELYEMAAEQPTVIETDIPIGGGADFGLNDKKVLVSFTGEESAANGWARRVLPTEEAASECRGCRDMRGDILRVVRETSSELMQRELVKVSSCFSRNSDFMGKIDLLVPREYAKHALDFVFNFGECDEKVSKFYKKSKPLDESLLRIVCYPEWVNDEWMYWKSRTSDCEIDDGESEPPRIMMIFDAEKNTAFLLGARHYSEIRNGISTLVWNMAVKKGVGMPFCGSSKTITTIQNGKRMNCTFLAIGASGTGKSALSLNDHKDLVKLDSGEVVTTGGDHAVVLLHEPSSRKRATVGVESNFYLCCHDFAPDTEPYDAVMSAENVMVTENDKAKRVIIHGNREHKIGKSIVMRERVSTGTGGMDTPWPDYLTMLTRDEFLPPVILVRDRDLLTALYMSMDAGEIDSEYPKFIPGANPWNIWGLEKELEMFVEMTSKVRMKGLIMNTGKFYGKGKPSDIPLSVSSSILANIARGGVKWKEWKSCPGLFLPDTKSREKFMGKGSEHYCPMGFKDDMDYFSNLKSWFECRFDFLRSAELPYRYLDGIYKIVSTLDSISD